MKNIIIYDNKKTWDRYTIIIDRDVYGMSDNALMPNGFNQYLGDYAEFDFRNNKAIGKRIQLKNLGNEVKEAIKRRYQAYAE